MLVAAKVINIPHFPPLFPTFLLTDLFKKCEIPIFAQIFSKSAGV
jgi:hypothetical protein